jgi:Protein of unknown function (DUF1553)/Protein of unknown function (DUF1549)
MRSSRLLTMAITLTAALTARGDASKHWAFQPVQTPTPPDVRDSKFTVRNPIDAFILARLQKEQIAPSSEADPRTLIRRLYLDLVGLPPRAEDVERYLRDMSAKPEAEYEALVDKLLASPHFGERWGRHWLDLARYAESDGYENDRIRQDAWRWRDWVIDAFNRDLPYDQFTIEQLAGDLLPNATTEQRVATGLHANTLWNSAASGDKEEFRTFAIKDRAETTATIWMGLTLGCANCHNHKYDPISQREFYQMYAFFNATDITEVPVTGGKAQGIKAAKRNSYVHLRGSFLRKGDDVGPGVPVFLPPLRARNVNGADRLDLAKWLVDPKHPLTSRVAVNHIWQHLFGQGIVPTPENFGTSGEPPSHPELLDWLANEFVRLGWSRKKLIRTIVLSSTYRQASTIREDIGEKDPKNQLLHRQNRFRVEAEIVRDLALSVSGLLDPKLGGPSIVPPFPKALPTGQFTAEALKMPTKEKNRRGIYIHVQRTLTHPSLSAFDGTDGNQPCVRRARSITPIQALTLLNDPTYIECAQALGKKLQQSSTLNDERIRAGFELCVSRPPRAEEMSVLQELIDSQKKRGAKDDALWNSVARVLLNMEEFTTRE